MRHGYSKGAFWRMAIVRPGRRSEWFVIRLIMLYFRKRSEVFTGNNAVIYRRRVPCIFRYTRPAYIVYCITRTKYVDERMDRKLVAHGDIEAVYYYLDGTECDRRTVWRVVIPPCFENMTRIREALMALDKRKEDEGR